MHMFADYIIQETGLKLHGFVGFTGLKNLAYGEKAMSSLVSQYSQKCVIKDTSLKVAPSCVARGYVYAYTLFERETRTGLKVITLCRKDIDL